MIINNYLLNYEKAVLATIRSASQELKKLPKGKLLCYVNKSHNKCYNQFFVMSDGKRKYLSKDDPNINLLAKKMFYQKLLENAKLNRDELEYLRNNIPDVSSKEILKSLPEWAQELINIPRNNDLLLSPDPAQAKILLDWQNASYHRKDNRNEGLKHRTSDGTLVRSKSEVLILEKVAQLKIACRYECGIEYEPGKWIFPDVTMMRIDTKLFYLEHCGLMNDPKYITDLKWKLNIYERLGIVPWDNLILTFDDSNGNIDMNLIEATLRSKLIML